MDKRNDLDDSSASRAISNAIRAEQPEDASQPDEAVYGDTDLNPNADDQRDAHRGEKDTA
ncbi:MAG: hypothetical protein DLM50_05755 [Candidatus Meridianibacter frigidus]|nr:MAG: hypothetical protein DLM50_05755 [Candidatus Eremiobacteraeota bacterium]